MSWIEPAETGGTIVKYEVELRKYVLTNTGEDETVSQQTYSLQAQEKSLSIVSLGQYNCSLHVTVNFFPYGTELSC